MPSRHRRREGPRGWRWCRFEVAARCRCRVLRFARSRAVIRRRATVIRSVVVVWGTAARTATTIVRTVVVRTATTIVRTALIVGTVVVGTVAVRPVGVVGVGVGGQGWLAVLVAVGGVAVGEV